MSDILVADDTRAIRNALSILLEEEGHTVRLASDGAEALAEYRKKRPDLLLLDVMMPKKSGYQVLRQIREADPTLPVMILSAKGSPADVALGLDLGSDDYLPKPFYMAELSARIKSVMRRGVGAVNRTMSVGNIVLDLQSRQVAIGGNPVALLKKEFDILLYFMQRPNRSEERL